MLSNKNAAVDFVVHFSFYSYCLCFEGLNVCFFLSLLFSGLLPEPSFASIENTRLTTAHVALLGISRHLASERQCHYLAAYLLERSPGGGKGFIERHTTSGAKVDWQLMALDILNNWCTEYPLDSTTTNLLQVLRYKLNAQAAANCLTEHFCCHGDGEVGFSQFMLVQLVIKLISLIQLASHSQTLNLKLCVFHS